MKGLQSIACSALFCPEGRAAAGGVGGAEPGGVLDCKLFTVQKD